MKIAFYDTKNYDKESFMEVNENYGFEITYFDFRLSLKTVSSAKGFDAVCVFVNDILNSDCLLELSKYNIGLVILRCAGFNNVDLIKAKELKIKIVRVPAYSPEAVAEFSISLLMSLTRKIPQAYNRTKNGNFKLDGLTGRNINGLFVGIIGTGKIGKAFAKIISSFGVRLFLYDKYPDYDWAERNGYKYIDLDELLIISDVLSLHCPLTNETKHIINEKNLYKMKKDAVIINTGRGALIDSHALVNALMEKRIGGAALDVYEDESEFFFNDFSEEIITDTNLIRLLTFPNVIVTSHQAFLTKQALIEIARSSLESARKIENKENCQNELIA